MGDIRRTIVATNAVTASRTQKRPGQPPGRSAVFRGVVIVVSIAIPDGGSPTGVRLMLELAPTSKEEPMKKALRLAVLAGVLVSVFSFSGEAVAGLKSCPPNGACSSSADCGSGGLRGLCDFSGYCICP